MVWLGTNGYSPSSRLSHCSICLVSDRSLVPTSTSTSRQLWCIDSIAHLEGICFSSCKFGNRFSSTQYDCEYAILTMSWLIVCFFQSIRFNYKYKMQWHRHIPLSSIHPILRAFYSLTPPTLNHVVPTPLLLFTLSTVILAPLVGGVAGSTILPLLLATLLAYCSTGYVRDELYHPLVKACVGSFCSLLVSPSAPVT